MRVRSALPHSSEAYRAVSGSVVVRNTFVRNACSSVLTPSLGSASLRLETLCVATMGMHFGCRESDRNRSSPVGLSPPTVAKFWYSSQMKRRQDGDVHRLGRNVRRLGCGR